MKKKSKLTKIVDCVGYETNARLENEIPKKVLMKIEDGDTCRTKCAAFIEIADTPYLQSKGLMKRASLGNASGMWFDCKGPFWMKNVEFPLDLCYIDNKGVITEKMAMAKDKKGRTLYRCKKAESVQAIELPYGFCDKHGIKIGDAFVPVLRIS